MLELSQVIESYRSVKSRSLSIRQFCKTAFLTELENELTNEIVSQIPADSSKPSEFAKNKRKRLSLEVNSLFEDALGFDLIKEDTTEPAGEQYSPVE